MQKQLGTVLSVSGPQMTVSVDGNSTASELRLGSMVTVAGATRSIVGTISAIQCETGTPARCVITADLMGEIDPTTGVFARGVSQHPMAGSAVNSASTEDYRAVYDPPSVPSVRVGTQFHDETRPAYLLVDDLLRKHFAIVGTTGSGKSCTVAKILSTILADNPNAHVLLLDPHNEYATAFGDIAEVVNVDNLELPLWLLNLEEAVRVLVRGGNAHEQESQAAILKDAIAWARRNYRGGEGVNPGVTVDTPVPYRIFDLLRFINDEMGRLGKPDTATPYLRLRTRIESLQADGRFRFMFTDTGTDQLADIAGRLLRIPVAGKPLAILDLSGVPTEVVDVLVSLIGRMLFDFSVWSDRSRMPPVLLVCEEAHRFVPADAADGFDAAARAITRIAKEGRKYGLSLALVSQRPSELATQAISQCGTVFALHLGNELDQNFMMRTLPDAARGMLASLPNLRVGEAVIAGEGVPMPMRIRFDELPAERRPHSSGADFSTAWKRDGADAEFREDVVKRWRSQRRDR